MDSFAVYAGDVMNHGELGETCAFAVIVGQRRR